MKPPGDTSSERHCLETEGPVPIPPIPGGPPRGGFREVWQLAYPVVITMASMSLMGLTDTFFMGFVGTPQQGAAGLGAVMSWTLMSFFNGTITATNTFVAQFYGAGQKEKSGPVVWQAFYVALVATGVVLIFLLPHIDLIVEAIGAKPRVSHHATRYMQVRLGGAPFMFTNFCVVGFLRGIGNTRTPMKVTLFANALNVLVTYLLVFGVGGLPALGVQGAALGTVVSQGVASGIYLHLIFSDPIHRTYRTRRFYPLLGDLMKRFLRVGTPIGLWWLLKMGAFTVFTMFVSTLGEIQLAGHQIVRQMIHLSFLPGVALSVAALTLVGQYLGAGDPDSAEKSARSAILIALGFMTSMGLLFVLLRTQIVTLFNRDPRVIDMAADLFFFAAVFQILDALGTVSSGAIRGAGDTRWPMLVSLGLSWLVFVPSIFFFGRVLGYGLYGAWAGATLYICILGIVLFARFQGGKWKKMTI